MTYGEFCKACADGKIVGYDMKSQRGYVSRRLKDSRPSLILEGNLTDTGYFSGHEVKY